MATADSTLPKLSFHKASGNYCKTVRGKRFYLGKNYAAALETWIKHKVDFELGVDPRKSASITATNRLTLRDGCNLFLDRRKDEIAEATWKSFKYECQKLVEFFGPDTPISSLTPDHFLRLKAHLENGNPVSFSNKVQRVKAVFRWLADRDYTAPVKYGPDFRPPDKKQLRRHRHDQAERCLSPDEFLSISNELGLEMRAATWLGFNAGFGPTDIYELPKRVVDFENAVIEWPRVKTAEDRVCPLWQETIEALAIWDKFRRKQGTKRFFEFRNADKVSRGFADGVKRAGRQRAGASFYSCRHTLATTGRGANDDAALRLILGHVDDSILDEHYTHRFPRERLDAVSEHVRQWLFGGRKSR